MKDLIESIRIQIYERLTSPLFGSFVVSWICWNYRFVTVLFSTLPIEKRFELIDKTIYSNGAEIFARGILGPASTTILFVLLYPRIAKFFFEEWLKKQVETKELRDKIEKTTMLTAEESQKILIRLSKAKDEYSQLLKEQEDQITALKNQTNSTDPHFINAIRFIVDENRSKGLKGLIENTIGPLDKAIPVIFKSKSFDEFIANTGIKLEIIENLNIREYTNDSPDNVFSATSFGVQMRGKYEQAEILFGKGNVVKMNSIAKWHFDYVYHALKTEVGHII